MAAQSTTVHASAVLVGAYAVLIRGPSGCGKSRLALDLLEAGRTGALLLTRLVADDRVYLEAFHGRLLVRPAEALAGLLEVRGVGLQRLQYEPTAVIGLVVDLAAEDARRLPDGAQRQTEIAGVLLPRLAVAAGAAALPALLAVLKSPHSSWI
jgi:HPr kinase/phosphorylase